MATRNGSTVSTAAVLLKVASLPCYLHWVSRCNAHKPHFLTVLQAYLLYATLHQISDTALAKATTSQVIEQSGGGMQDSLRGDECKGVKCMTLQSWGTCESESASLQAVAVRHVCWGSRNE